MKESNSNPKADVHTLTYEQAYEELDGILRQLESEQASLEDTLALFERGKALVEHCNTLLDAADLRLRTLSEDGIIEEADDEEN